MEISIIFKIAALGIDVYKRQGIQKPRQPESTVKPVEINIPDFLKNSRR